MRLMPPGLAAVVAAGIALPAPAPAAGAASGVGSAAAGARVVSAARASLDVPTAVRLVRAALRSERFAPRSLDCRPADRRSVSCAISAATGGTSWTGTASVAARPRQTVVTYQLHTG